ncbi:M20 family metallopeptidase [Candidatus Bathyarchaeota archaeon]|jgi:amidohydrolase|nr:M20 family metallopeptidase [Candidatus Bathyarchaeota archaeon]MBT4320803.1 M20 family metallopeptidase [Candidatus Bathyarchaeota archaeon]MBT4423077.1 M20 family metallopeptidase [Candidatus Bathyarchaeota archaeon]MBT6605456.1 M20 family metallopeptidase [Candidatus Bathyarchaeota archaeon]MBT7186177.1 M20 family metallopeptidase [Candidatus Bathyarchaeota archaeon]
MAELNSLKNIVKEIVDEKRPVLEDIAKYLYDNPELGSEEFKAFAKITKVLEDHGFDVEKGVYDMPTAFVATYKGKGDGPKVAVLAEYDALPGVGHGCGHDLIAASAVGAGIAASKAIADLDGEILVIGTPAEEGHGPSGGSKVIMANKGLFDDISGVVMLHPASAWGVGSQALGISKCNMVFKGQTSHAAASPHLGRNALNAATLAYTATHMLRQEARRDANLVIHGIITEGGIANNIIPDRAVLSFGVRSSDQEYLDEMVDKVARCGEGAAHALGVEVEIDKGRFYSSKKLNYPMIKALWQNYVDLGAPVSDWEESANSIPMASTDYGDVSQVVPSAGSYIGIAPAGTPGHSIQLADASMTKKGLDAMIVGTKALGMTLVELLAKPEILVEAKEYFDSH